MRIAGSNDPRFRQTEIAIQRQPVDGPGFLERLLNIEERRRTTGDPGSVAGTAIDVQPTASPFGNRFPLVVRIDQPGEPGKRIRRIFQQTELDKPLPFASVADPELHAIHRQRFARPIVVATTAFVSGVKSPRDFPSSFRSPFVCDDKRFARAFVSNQRGVGLFLVPTIGIRIPPLAVPMQDLRLDAPGRRRFPELVFERQRTNQHGIQRNVRNTAREVRSSVPNGHRLRSGHGRQPLRYREIVPLRRPDPVSRYSERRPMLRHRFEQPGFAQPSRKVRIAPGGRIGNQVIDPAVFFSL